MKDFNKESIKEAIIFELDKFKELISFSGQCDYETSIVDILTEVFSQPPFETLNQRYQLGLLNRVNVKWENVRHTRFDHSVGVATKCLVVCSILNKKTDNYKIEFDDILELCIAASLHDIAHLPYSHAFERGVLSHVEYNAGVSHEDRVAPLLVEENQYFEKIRDITLTNSKREDKNHSILRIVCLISEEMGKKHTKGISNFEWPSKALHQLLSSELDLDRLDYIIRDTEAVNYTPVTKIHREITAYLNELSLKEIKLINQSHTFGKYELCLPDSSLHSAFNLLVSRVLLYKNIYFSREVRAFEANLTDLIDKLITNRIPLDLLELSTMGDDEFRDNKLPFYKDKIRNNPDKLSIVSYIDAIQKTQTNKFSFVFSIQEDIFKHPRLKEEFCNNINSRDYIHNLKKAIVTFLNNSQDTNGIKYAESEFLFDIFNLKTGGGDFLVIEEKVKENNGKEERTILYKTLKDYMNGSNMARLCKESRVDIYLNSHYHGSGNVEKIKIRIKLFFDQFK